MKNILKLVFLLTLCLNIIGCSSDDNNSTPVTETTKETVAPKVLSFAADFLSDGKALFIISLTNGEIITNEDKFKVVIRDNGTIIKHQKNTFDFGFDSVDKAAPYVNHIYTATITDKESNESQEKTAKKVISYRPKQEFSIEVGSDKWSVLNYYNGALNDKGTIALKFVNKKETSKTFFILLKKSTIVAGRTYDMRDIFLNQDPKDSDLGMVYQQNIDKYLIPEKGSIFKITEYDVVNKRIEGSFTASLKEAEDLSKKVSVKGSFKLDIIN